VNAPLRSITLEDKYTLESGRVFLTGIQALARLPMLQRDRDLAAGLNTAGFISGYRGSPLGGLDQALWKAKEQLAAHHIRFQPGVNEDLAATAIWGTQQVNLFPGANYDGVFAMWYGKGPGVDRCGDVFKHANSAGTWRHGGVLAVAGDDHAARSSTVAHQSEHAFKTVMMPVLAPSGVQEYLDLGLHGWALSRYSGCWVAFKAVADTIESSASVDIAPERVRIVIPTDYELPADGLNIRWPDPPLVQEARLLNHKLYAALAYCRANRLNRVVIDSPNPRLGIITCGKSYLDVRQAFDDLGIDDALAAEIGIRLYKVGMVWPLEADGVRRFAEGLDEILVVEEKRQFIEYQLKEELYNWREDVRPRVIGKFDEKGEWALPHGDWLLPATSELSPAQIARVIADRIGRRFTSPRIRQRLELIEARERALAAPVIPIQRTPTFCPGCPHNTSTRVPEGSMALAGIGCHYMVTWMDRNTATFSHMGGEGAAWIGQAPFTERRHVFANLGDGTYFHSGLLAIRAAVAANVPITYKLLYNDAVAMDLPEGIEMRHRRELDAIQRELREVPGVTAIIYDQTCAAEKRRRRKRGKYPDPAVRVFINERVCEGCGDCGVQSNCMAVVPLETEYGRKRAIDQSACNKDYSCLDGLCPSFVTVEGGRLKKGRAMDGDESGFVEPRAPVLPDTAEPWNILIAGVGGSGVITIGALIGMAAHIDGKGVSVLDMTGLAQKGGAVFSHVRIADSPDDLHAVRIATGEADAVIAGDVIVAASREALIKMAGSRTRAIVNSCETPTAEFTRDPDWQFPLAKMQDAIRSAVGSDAATFIDATALATRLLGDAIGTNLFLLGHAWQQGLVPVSGAALERAIELNGTAVEANLKAFLWGRRAALNRPGVERYADPHRHEPPAPQTLAELIESRAADLTAYQDVAYAQRYRAQVDQWRAATADFQERVARNYHKLLAVKDEYEIARLYNDPAFREQIGELFEGDYEIRYHLAPPMISPVDYEADLALALANNSAGNADAVRALLSWPDHVRGYGVVKTKSIAEAMQLRAAAREKLSR